MVVFENRDCLEAMKETPDKFFELAIVDPPYGGGFTEGGGVQGMVYQIPPTGNASGRGSAATSDRRKCGVPRGGYHGKYQHGNLGFTSTVGDDQSGIWRCTGSF